MLKNTKIVFVLDSFIFGGAERQALHLAEYLFERTSAEILFLSLNGTQDGYIKDRLNFMSINFYDFHFEFKSSHLGRTLELFSLIFKIRKHAPDIILPFTIRPNVNINAVWRLTQAKICFWNQRDIGFGFSFNRKDKIFLWALKNCPFYISNSQLGIEAIRKFDQSQGKESKLIFNGIPEIPYDSKLVDWKKLLKLPADTKVVTMISNITKYKDHLTLLKAWKKVSITDDFSNFVLVLAGKQGETFSTIKSFVEENNLSAKVKFTGEIADTYSLMKITSLAIHSSKSEGMSNSVLEYMAAGLPVVASRIEGNIKALGGDYPLLFEEGNSRDLEDVLTHALANIDNIQKIGLSNKIRVKKLFSVTRMAEEYINLFQKFI